MQIVVMFGHRLEVYDLVRMKSESRKVTVCFGTEKDKK